MKLFFIALLMTILSIQGGMAQMGVFTEFDLEASEEVKNVDGIILESRIGVMYRLSEKFRLRAGVSRIGRRDFRAGYYSKEYYIQTEDISYSEFLNLYHRALSSGFSCLTGFEIVSNRIVFGLDLHWVRRSFKHGFINAFYQETERNLGITREEEYDFPTNYKSINYLKSSVKLGYNIYSRPRGGISWYINYAYDFSENSGIKADFVDPQLIELNDRLEEGEIYGQSFSDFLGSSRINYYRHYFSVGMNVTYFFNVGG